MSMNGSDRRGAAGASQYHWGRTLPRLWLGKAGGFAAGSVRGVEMSGDGSARAFRKPGGAAVFHY